MKLSCLTSWNILVVFPHSFPVSSRSGGTELGSLLVLSTFAAWAAQKPVLKFCVRMFLETFIFSGSSANLLLQMLGNAGKWWKQAASSLTKDFYCCWLCRRDFKVNFKIVLPRKSWFRRMALANMHREEVCSQLFLQTACIWCLSWIVVCRKLFCPEWESQQCQGPITPSLSKVSVLFTVWTGWLKIPVLVCASKRFWWQGPLNAMQTPASLLGAPRRLLGEEDTPSSRQGATRSEGGGCPSLSPHWCSWLLLPCLRHLTPLCLPHKGSACPAAPSLFYERKLSQHVVLTNAGRWCFSYPLAVSLENSLKQKHKMGFVEMC